MYYLSRYFGDFKNKIMKSPFSLTHFIYTLQQGPWLFTAIV